MAYENMNKFDLIYITDDIELAKLIEDSNVDRLMVDLETLGKKKRQLGSDTYISKHRIQNINPLRKILNKKELVVRVNPINKNSKDEINKVLDLGADRIMLPMFKSVKEVELFLKYVNNKSKSTLLFETPASISRINQIIKINDFDEVYIGLNDLKIAFDLDFLFEFLSGGLLEYMSKIFNNNKINFGFGGIAKLGSGKVQSNLILSEHVRLGSSSVILSSLFRKQSNTFNENEFLNEIDKIKDEVIRLRKLDNQVLLDNRDRLYLEIQNYLDS